MCRCALKNEVCNRSIFNNSCCSYSVTCKWSGREFCNLAHCHLLQQTGAFFLCASTPYRFCSSTDSDHIFSDNSLDNSRHVVETFHRGSSKITLFNVSNMEQIDNFLMLRIIIRIEEQNDQQQIVCFVDPRVTHVCWSTESTHFGDFQPGYELNKLQSALERHGSMPFFTVALHFCSSTWQGFQVFRVFWFQFQILWVHIFFFVQTEILRTRAQLETEKCLSLRELFPALANKKVWNHHSFVNSSQYPAMRTGEFSIENNLSGKHLLWHTDIILEQIQYVTP